MNTPLASSVRSPLQSPRLALALLLGAVLAFSFFSAPASASIPTDPGIPDLTTRASARAWHNKWWAQTYGAAMGFTGDVLNGVPGDVSEDFRNQALLRYNMLRRMVGCQPFTLDAKRNATAQLAAMFIAANGYGRHGGWPTTAKFYSEAADLATQVCLLGYNWSDPEEGWGYLYDFGDANIGGVGHRISILAPWVETTIGLGDVPATDSTKKAEAFNLSASDATPNFDADGFVLWPCAGYVPHYLVTGQWSIAIPDKMTTVKWSFKAATITVLKDGVAQTITGGAVGASDAMVWTIDGTLDGSSQYSWYKLPSGESFYGNPTVAKDVVYHVIIDGIRKRVTPAGDPGAPDQGGGELYKGTGRYEYDVVGYNPSLDSTLAVSTQPLSQTVVAGGATILTVEATGATSYQWYKDWTPISGATQTWLSLTNFQASDAGRYHVLIKGDAGTIISSYATLSYAATAPTSTAKLVNVSTRSYVSAASDAVLVAGFVVTGTEPKQVLIRAAGPALTGLISRTPLSDPVLKVFNSVGTQIATNDDWSTEASHGDKIEAAAKQAYAFAWTRGSKDAALLLTLAPGLYTAEVSGKSSAAGIALVEVFEMGANGSSRMVNISGRSMNAIAGEPSIPGFVISGTGKKKVLIRAAGPSLTGMVASPMADPELVLFDAKGAQVAYNDDWSSDSAKATELEAAFASTYAFTWLRGSKDAAILIELDPGLYTAYGRGKGEATGITLVEVYEVP